MDMLHGGAALRPDRFLPLPEDMGLDDEGKQIFILWSPLDLVERVSSRQVGGWRVHSSSERLAFC